MDTETKVSNEKKKNEDSNDRPEKNTFQRRGG